MSRAGQDATLPITVIDPHRLDNIEGQLTGLEFLYPTPRKMLVTGVNLISAPHRPAWAKQQVTRPIWSSDPKVTKVSGTAATSALESCTSDPKAPVPAEERLVLVVMMSRELAF
jgi:hypothetical protein